MKNSYNLFNQPLQFNLLLNEKFLINGQVFCRNYDITNKIVYETKDKLYSIHVGEFHLQYNIKTINKNYIKNFRKKCKKKNYLIKRTKKLEDEITRVNNIETKIKLDVINNLNFTKTSRYSHYKNCKNKLIGSNVYTKPLFLYELHEDYNNSETKVKIINYINNIINIVLDIDIDFEELFIYFTICKIIKNIELYKNYLLSCIDNIHKNIFNLNTNYCMINDVLHDRICENGNNRFDEIYSEYYIFRDYNTYAIDNKNKCMCLGYVLALSKSDNKWNVFPENNDDLQYYISNKNIDDMIKFIKEHENEGIHLMEQQLF